MARLNAQKITAKWKSRVAGAVQDYIDGINSTDVNPMQLAVDHQDALIARFTEAVRSGNWAAALLAVLPGDWKKSATGLGAQHYSDGATKGEPKMNKYLTAALPRIEAIRNEIRAMPNSTKADRKARMDRNFELMAGLKGIGRTAGS